VIATEGLSAILLLKRPVLDEWTSGDAPLSGTLALWGRCLALQPAGDRERHTLLWPAGYRARVEDGALEIVDGSGAVVARVGQEVRLPGGAIPVDGDSPRFRRLFGELPCGCNGPYWIVAD
jgi:hypothetical protein